MSDVRDPERDQVAPTPNSSPSCHDLVISDIRKARVGEVVDAVIADIEERKQFGLQKYGSLLQPFNGRSFTLDCYEESLDLIAYLRGKIHELGLEQSQPWLGHYQAVVAATLDLRRALELERNSSHA